MDLQPQCSLWTFVLERSLKVLKFINDIRGGTMIKSAVSACLCGHMPGRLSTGSEPQTHVPVYRQSSPAVGCHYFPSGLQSSSQPKNVTTFQPIPFILFDDRGTCVWTICPRLLCSFIPVGIEPATYWSQIQCLTTMPLHHLCRSQYNMPWLLYCWSWTILAAVS